MSSSKDIDPLVALTAALGGRRVNTLLWALWLLAGVIANYAQTMARSDMVHGKTKAVFAACVIGFVVYSVMLARGLLSKERRSALLSKRPHLPEASLSLRFFAWLIALLALGAGLSPIYFR